MLPYLHTIKSKDGKIMHHGTIVDWFKCDELMFVPCGSNILTPFWCKLDAWDVYQGIVPLVGKISTKTKE